MCCGSGLDVLASSDGDGIGLSVAAAISRTEVSVANVSANTLGFDCRGQSGVACSQRKMQKRKKNNIDTATDAGRQLLPVANTQPPALSTTADIQMGFF